MADALEYHFGVPLYLLNYFKLPNQDIWLHGSLFGNGELFNAIGLYLNSDNFFTFFQFLSLVLFFEFLRNKEKDSVKFKFIFFFIISSPVILFLISGPKPLLFPQLLTTAALYIFIKEKEFNIKNIILIGILLMGAIQFKLSFVLSCAFLGLLVLIKSYQNHKKSICYLILLLIFFFLPKAIYNFNQVSEFNLINIFTTLPNDFLAMLSDYRDNNFIFPINLFIPNSFTPNGDGTNDIFEIRGLSVYIPTLKIFNRWGVQVYTSNNLWWTGDSGSGYYCDNGVYNWIIEYKDKFGQNKQESGYVTLIR